MTQERRSGPRPARPASDDLNTLDAMVQPAYPRSAARRIHWHHVLVRRRRWSRELDRLCGTDSREVAV